MEKIKLFHEKNMLEEILGKEKLEEKDFDEIEKILNKLYEKQTTAQEINVKFIFNLEISSPQKLAKHSKIFLKFLIIN